MNITELTVHELQEKIKSKEITITQIVEAYCERIKEKESKVDAFITLQIEEAIEKAKKQDKPSMIIANTIKGKGISFMENQVAWHGKAPNEEEYKKAMEELEVIFAEEGGEN